MEDIEFLVRQAQRGNHEAFIQLITGYEQVLYLIAKRFLHNSYDVADVMQETILISYRDIKKLKSPKYFNTWIYKILVNNCKKYLEKNNKLAYEEHDQSVNYLADKLELNELIGEIADTYKIPLILFYYNDLSLNEITEILDLPIGTVKSRLSRGRNLLEAAYKQ
ncbi:RNA polymerase sigma factor [Enterococcus diestrammenae]|uniref:RNA polymerase sigma factor n=1 Tax=Enterococcus diestrammenae TaxID=1155073 RepID=UPI0022E18B77|nr:sigma-70 family RNA polymerase sigma factor [Enterococcus diestrammenae]